jgi:O-antigen/teichoic acid export membrane protein
MTPDALSNPTAPAGTSGVVGPEEATRVGESSLRHTFVRGVMWTSAATIFGKVASFASQFLLGRIFTEDIYGLFAMAITAATIGEVFANGGIKTVVVARAAEYPRIARTASVVAQGVSSVAALLIVLTSPFWAYVYFGQPTVMWLLIIIAASLLIGSMATVYRAKLDSDLRVKPIALIESVAAGLRHSLVVVFAYMGLKEYSFVIPIVLMSAWYAISSRIFAGAMPKSKFDRSLAWDLLRQGKWVVITGIGATIIARGDYFVGGGFAKFHPEWIGILGLYFFGYQLTHSLFGPFNIGLQSIMQPGFAKLKGNLQHQASTYFTVIRMTVFVAVPITIAGALIAPLLIHCLWPDGKWDRTIPVVQLLALTESVRQLHFISVAVLSARERFRSAATITIIDGVLTMVAALIGCLVGQHTSVGGLLSLTIAIAIQRTVMSLIEAAVVYRMIGGKARHVLMVSLCPLVPAVLVAAGVYYGIHHIRSTPMALYSTAALAAIPLFAVHVLMLRVLARRQFEEACALMSRLLPRRFHRPLPSHIGPPVN